MYVRLVPNFSIAQSCPPSGKRADGGLAPRRSCQQLDQRKKSYGAGLVNNPTPNWGSYCLSAMLIKEKYSSRKKILLINEWRCGRTRHLLPLYLYIARYREHGPTRVAGQTLWAAALPRQRNIAAFVRQGIAAPRASTAAGDIH